MGNVFTNCNWVIHDGLRAFVFPFGCSTNCLLVHPRQHQSMCFSSLMMTTCIRIKQLLLTSSKTTLIICCLCIWSTSSPDYVDRTLPKLVCKSNRFSFPLRKSRSTQWSSILCIQTLSSWCRISLKLGVIVCLTGQWPWWGRGRGGCRDAPSVHFNHKDGWPSFSDVISRGTQACSLQHSIWTQQRVHDRHKRVSFLSNFLRCPDAYQLWFNHRAKEGII